MQPEYGHNSMGMIMQYIDRGMLHAQFACSMDRGMYHGHGHSTRTWTWTWIRHGHRLVLGRHGRRTTLFSEVSEESVEVNES
jgi:hypothetical protein